MADIDAKSMYFRQFRTRVRNARIARGYKQKDIAFLLDMEQDTYKQYETRSLLPHHLVAKFCMATGVSIAWLMGEEGHGPSELPPLKTERTVRPTARKRQRA